MKSVMDRTKIDPKHAGDLWDALREKLGPFTAVKG